MKQFNIGDKVHYQPEQHESTDTHQNGIVKEVIAHGVRVVYHCDNQWGRYMHYTSALTRPEDLRKGWK